MLAKIRFHKDILKALFYNEEKLIEGKATPLWAENFLKDHHQLSTREKIDRFNQRSSLNDRLEGHGVHFSLNFGKTERIDDDKMVILSRYYMKAMGFEDQPYLVYRHNDAGHTHDHIVATAVSEEGRKVKIRPMDFPRSYAICKEMEEKFSLEKNERLSPEEEEQFKVQQAKRVVYGEPGLKRAISDVLNTVVDHYNYTSLDELNAVLKQYNVMANPGNEGSRLRQFKGLLYHALDEDGSKIGIPLKASKFLLKPTLSHLEERFRINQSQRENFRDQLHTAIEWAFAGTTPDWKEFRESMEKDGIGIEEIKAKNGSAGNIYFINHMEKYVFSGDSLGLRYDSANLRERCSTEHHLRQEETERQYLKLHL